MTIGFTCGAFDLLHTGHIIMFEECKRHCDLLIVGLHSDPSLERMGKNRPIQSLYERYIQLMGCKYIDSVFPYETEEDLENIMAIENIQVRFVGEEYMGLQITGEKICIDKGIQIIHTSRKHSYSSKSLREKIYARSNK